MNIGMSGNRSAAGLGCIPVLLAALAAVPLTGCVSNVPDQSVVAAQDDAITADVYAALQHDPRVTESDIDVRTNQGIVRLSGFVVSTDSVGVAASVARTVKGVRSVRNDLRLK
jgi:osmotically-inducible protein OsmY